MRLWTLFPRKDTGSGYLQELAFKRIKIKIAERVIFRCVLSTHVCLASTLKIIIIDRLSTYGIKRFQLYRRHNYNDGNTVKQQTLIDKPSHQLQYVCGPEWSGPNSRIQLLAYQQQNLLALHVGLPYFICIIVCFIFHFTIPQVFLHLFL